MKQDGKIEIYEDVLKELDEVQAASAPEPALPPGFTFPTK
jgi:hypothetical protein